MKKILLVLVAMLLASPVMAAEHNTAGVKVDAPQLVKLSENWALGAEGGKDIVNNLLYSDSDYLEADRGYFGYVKVTYNGTLLNLKK